MPVRKQVRPERATAPQAGFAGARRRKNGQGAFEATRGARFDGMSVLLIDDVPTTGASAWARALKRAGAAHVWLLALARRDRLAGVEVRLNALPAASRSVKR